jgi:hypothetical protein
VGAARLGPDRCHEFLTFLVDEHAQVDWTLLAPFAALAEPTVDVQVIRLLQPGDRLAALPWFVSAVGRHAQNWQSGSWEFSPQHLLWLLRGVLPQLEGLAEGSLARDAARSAIAYLEEIPDPSSTVEDDDDWEWIESEQGKQQMELYRPQVLRLIAALKRAAAIR